MSADKIEVGLIAQRISHVTGVLDFREKEAYAFVGWQLESMRKKIRVNFLVRGEGFLGIAREHMNFMSPFAELVAEVRGYSPRSADGVREENIG